METARAQKFQKGKWGEFSSPSSTWGCPGQGPWYLLYCFNTELETQTGSCPVRSCRQLLFTRTQYGWSSHRERNNVQRVSSTRAVPCAYLVNAVWFWCPNTFLTWRIPGDTSVFVNIFSINTPQNQSIVYTRCLYSPYSISIRFCVKNMTHKKKQEFYFRVDKTSSLRGGNNIKCWKKMLRAMRLIRSPTSDEDTNSHFSYLSLKLWHYRILTRIFFFFLKTAIWERDTSNHTCRKEFSKWIIIE